MIVANMNWQNISITAKSKEKINKNIGEVLKKNRLLASMSQAEVSKIIGVTYQQYQKYELSKNKMNLHSFLAYCAAIQKDPAKVITDIWETILEE